MSDREPASGNRGPEAGAALGESGDWDGASPRGGQRRPGDEGVIGTGREAAIARLPEDGDGGDPGVRSRVASRRQGPRFSASFLAAWPPLP
jgi:hypothetical protein